MRRTRNAKCSAIKFRGNFSLSGLVFGFASSLAKVDKLILSGCIVKPLARLLVALLESQLEGNGTPSMELAGARQFASFGLDLFKIGHCLTALPVMPRAAYRSLNLNRLEKNILCILGSIGSVTSRRTPWRRAG
jgi:hypothetical protein